MPVIDNMRNDTYKIESAENPVDVIIALLRDIPCVDVFPPLIGNTSPGAIDPNMWYLSKSIFPEYPCPGPDGTNNPPAATNDIVVCQTSGKAGNPKWLIDYPGITILVRTAGSRYPQAYDICRCINDVLLGARGFYYGPSKAEYVFGYRLPKNGEIATHVEEPEGSGMYILAREGEMATHFHFDTTVPCNESNRDQLVSITQQGQVIDLGRESRDTVKRCNFSLNYDLIVQPAQTPLSCREPLL